MFSGFIYWYPFSKIYGRFQEHIRYNIMRLISFIKYKVYFLIKFVQLTNDDIYVQICIKYRQINLHFERTFQGQREFSDIFFYLWSPISIILFLTCLYNLFLLRMFIQKQFLPVVRICRVAEFTKTIRAV